jgi:hypothetical protein
VNDRGQSAGDRRQTGIEGRTDTLGANPPIKKYNAIEVHRPVSCWDNVHYELKIQNF